MRPTGKLHLGNLVGALENWVVMQDEYDSYHLIADYHALTTNPDSSSIERDTREMVMDWLAAGIDPERSPIFRQSHVKEHTELFLILSMLITTSRLERNPTLKDQVRDLKRIIDEVPGAAADLRPAQEMLSESERERAQLDAMHDVISLGHLAYPVLQAADVMLYKGEIVPVGEDQLPHLEITRELARRFNKQYGVEVFPEPTPKLTVFPRLPGLDRAKMSKSLNNAILMSDPPDEVSKKLRGAITDEQKIRKSDPGHPEICVIFTYHKKFNRPELEEIETNCRSGALGCADCKKRVGATINEHLAPMIARRAVIESTPGLIDDVLASGEERARAAARDTMYHVRSAMHLG